MTEKFTSEEQETDEPFELCNAHWSPAPEARVLRQCLDLCWDGARSMPVGVLADIEKQLVSEEQADEICWIL